MGFVTPAWQRREDLFLVPRGGWLLVSTLLLAVVLAGGRPLWAQGIVTAGVGLLWLIRPPDKLPSNLILGLLAALALAPLAAYLPATWFGEVAWRENLKTVPAITLAGTISPQPWFTFHTWLLWLAGVGLAAWCACQAWDHYHRDTLARMFTGGMVLVTGYAFFAYWTESGPEWWINKDGFGPFANRNQWGSLLGLCSVMALALVHQSVRHLHKRGVIFWALAWALFAWAVVQNGSRGGIVVLVAGGFSYWMFFGLARKEYRYAAVAMSFLLISFALFSLGGGPLLERFVDLREGGWEKDMRVQFYRMTRNLMADAPWTGFGLGNFEFVFPFYLDYEPALELRALHPESSWLWLASEGGWLLLAVVAAALVALIVAGYGARRSRATTIRSAGLACALVMMVHAFFEVSGHRLGTLFPAILLASLALPAAGRPWPAHWPRPLLRTGGVVLLVAGGTWILASVGTIVWPAVQGTAALQTRAGVAREAGQIPEAVALLEKAAALKPLSYDIRWSLAAFLLEDGETDQAWSQFRAANGLLPYLSWIIDTEGYFWIPTSPARAVYAWTEALRRANASKRPTMYGVYLRQARERPALQALLLQLYPEDPEFEFVRVREAGADGVKRLPNLLRMTDNLARAPDHLVEPVLRYMANHNQLDRLPTDNPRLRRLGWQALAVQAAREGNFEEALALHFQHGPKPVLPASISRSDLRSVERAAALAPMDIATAIAYYQALEAARRRDDAFWQLRRIMDFPNAPDYVWYLAARTAHERGRHDEAWEFLQTYLNKTRR